MTAALRRESLGSQGLCSSKFPTRQIGIAAIAVERLMRTRRLSRFQERARIWRCSSYGARRPTRASVLGRAASWSAGVSDTRGLATMSDNEALGAIIRTLMGQSLCVACIASRTALSINRVLETLEHAASVLATEKDIGSCPGCHALRPIHRISDSHP